MNKIIFLATILLITLSGCSLTFQSAQKDLGGVFKSIDGGESWTQASLFPTTTGSPQSIQNLNTNEFLLDPTDNNTLYFGSSEQGLFYTYDNATKWSASTRLGQTTINVLAVNPNSRCILYAGIANEVRKTHDCGRFWETVYHGDRSINHITAIAIETYNSNKIYVAISDGSVIKSLDGGKSWQSLQKFKSPIKKIIINSNDNKFIFFASDKEIFRTLNGGENVESLSDILKTVWKGTFRDLQFSKAKKGTVYLTTSSIILRSGDNGYHWNQLNLLTSEKNAVINTLALSATNEKKIYYSTNTTFYKSIDGGENWTTKQLNTARAGWKILVDPRNDQIIYLGVKALK